MENTISALKELLARCKCGVYLTVNENRDYYRGVEQYLGDLDKIAMEEDSLEVSDDVRQQMIATNTFIHLQFYPDTPIGSYSVYHHDLDAALNEALACLKEES